MADEKRPVGRPSSYEPRFADMAFKLCLLGATDAEMADIFGVTVATLNNWKDDHPEFFESLTRGKHEADAEVAHSLFKRATGYTAKKTVTATFEGVVSDVREVNEYVGPDTNAASLWLRNRQPGKWRDKQVVEHEVADSTADRILAARKRINGED